MAIDIADAESRLWAAADKLWANTGLKPSEFSTPVLGLIFLRYSQDSCERRQEIIILIATTMCILVVTFINASFWEA